jgi:hypothetical protein
MVRALCSMKVVPPISIASFSYFKSKTDTNKACNENHLQDIYKGVF